MSALSRLHIHPRWHKHVPDAQRMNAALREMGDVIPPLRTPEDIAAVRNVPEVFLTQELPLPVETRTVPGPDGERSARVVVPDVVRGVVLDLHGGGFCLGWPQQKDLSNARLAAAAEVAVVSVDYRLAPENPYPAGPNDCNAAAEWLVDAAKSEFGTETILLAGDSAGGCLAVLTAIHLRSQGLVDRIAGLALTYGIYDLSGTPSARSYSDNLVLTTDAMHRFHELYLPGLTNEDMRNPAISPLYADVSGLPPALLCAGTLDPLLDDSLFMAARMQAAGGHADLYVVPESPHGFAAFPNAMAAELEVLIAEWVRERITEFAG